MTGSFGYCQGPGYLLMFVCFFVFNLSLWIFAEFLNFRFIHTGCVIIHLTISRYVQQEMKGKRVNLLYRPYSQGKPCEVISSPPADNIATRVA